MLYEKLRNQNTVSDRRIIRLAVVKYYSISAIRACVACAWHMESREAYTLC